MQSLGPRFVGAGRYELERRLGAGGFGVVYQAFDRERRERVALKTLPRLEPTALYAFKQEFRSLAGTLHPHLVSLYELFLDDNAWFFTMELIEGTSFLSYVRPRSAMLGYPRTIPFESDTRHVGDDGWGWPTQVPTREHRPSGGVFNEQRLREALGQLALGVLALHEAGKIHRDLKPSNVMVTNTGRLVILDFGLVTELRSREQAPMELSGTVEYMAPEQARGRVLTEAADWYALGVMLFEAMTGTLPFTGSPPSVLMAKQSRDPRRPSDVAEGVPEDLGRLCVALLSRDPSMRPSGHEILRMLGGEEPTGPISEVGALGEAPRTGLRTGLVGRDAALGVLWQAFDTSRAGTPTVVELQGASGIGKSALLDRFSEQLMARGVDMALSARCYERESVPYKALDNMIDALSRRIRSMPEGDLAKALPHDIAVLARLFPVLQSVEAIARAVAESGDRPKESIDPQEIRRRAFSGLRDLLRNLAAATPVVLMLDDLQWGDLDSASLLAELFKEPGAPPLMLVVSYRSESRSQSGFLETFAVAIAACPNVATLTIELGPLGAAETRRLIRQLGGPGFLVHDELVAVIEREACGSPFFIHELVRYAAAASLHAVEGPIPLSLSRVLIENFQRLPEPARLLLSVVAVAGRPIRESDALQAAALAFERAPMELLRAQHFVRMPAAGPDWIECYHDRIRESVVARLDRGELRKCHECIAQTLEAARNADPELLAVHFREANIPDKARRYAAIAADRASRALAFERAAWLYAMALELAPTDDPQRAALERGQADALAATGRSASAAEHYLEAARTAPRAEGLGLRRAAAEQFLISGHLDEGLTAFRDVLAEVRLRMPHSSASALVRVGALRALLRARGLGFEERSEASLSSAELSRIDACWAAALGLGMVDNIRGTYFQSLHLLLALRAGEPYRVARALAVEVGYRATAGKSGRRESERVSNIAIELAQRVGNPHAIGLSTVTSGLVAYLQGEWRHGRERIERGAAILRARCNGVAWELTNAMLFSLRCALYLGELPQVCQSVPDAVNEARERGDLYAVTYYQLRYAYLADLARDEPDRAAATVLEALSRWSQKGFHLQHYLHVFAQCEIALYRGDGLAAWQGLEKARPAIRRSLLLRVQHLRIEAAHLRARAALCAGREGSEAERRRLVRIAAGEARALDAEGVPWAGALAQLVRACIEELEGGADRAGASFSRAVEQFDRAEMALHSAAARRCSGLLTKGREGVESTARADAILSAAGIQHPGRWAGMVTGVHLAARGSAPGSK